MIVLAHSIFLRIHPSTGLSRLKGNWVVKVKTAADRFTRAVRSIDQMVPRPSSLAARRTTTEAESEVTRTLCVLWSHRQLRITCRRFQQEVENRWRKWLNRRNNIRSMHWAEVLCVDPPLPAGSRSHHALATSARSETMI